MIKLISRKSNRTNMVVEIPYGSFEKIEWNPIKQIMEVDRLEPSTFPEPVNYGFIPDTIGGDGDALDVILVSDTPHKTGEHIQVKIIGVMKFIDEGYVDDKIVTVPKNSKNINTLADIKQDKITEIEYYFNHYKDYKKVGITSVKGWGGVLDANRCINEASKAWRQE